MSEANWYVAHTYSGYENKVKANIEKTIENRHLQDQILEVLVPMEDVQEVKNGVTKQVLVNMIMNDDTWYVVRNTRGVTGFVGPGSKPVPLSESEIKALGMGDVILAADSEYKVGDSIIVTSGVWDKTVGMIKSVNAGKRSVTINVDMFGRETPVELSFTEIKKM